MNDELKKELDILLDKYGVTLQIRQSIVFVPKAIMNEEENEVTPEVEETPEVAEETVEETAPEEVAE